MFPVVNNNLLINPNFYGGFTGFGNSYPTNNYFGNNLFDNSLLGNNIFGGYNNYNAGFGSNNLGQGNNILSLLIALLGSLGGSSNSSSNSNTSNTSGLNISDLILGNNSSSDSSDVVVDDEIVDSAEPKKVYIVGSYATAGNNIYSAGSGGMLTLGDTIMDYSGVEQGDRTSGMVTYLGARNHESQVLGRGGNVNSDNDEEFMDVYNKMSDADRNRTFRQGEAYIIDEDGNVLGTVASDQLADPGQITFDYGRNEFKPTFATNNNFQILNDLGVADGGETSTIIDNFHNIGEFFNQEGTGGRISLNGVTYDVGSTILRKYSPLAFDLNGDGIKTTDKTVQFDIDGDGKDDTINDVADGVLAFDADGDGKVGENAKEVFGNNTVIDGKKYNDGFDALKALALKAEVIDGKKDMKLDAKDIEKLEKEYGFMMKANGYKSEAQSLKSLGISEIDLSSSDKVKETLNFDGKGNKLTEKDGANFLINGQKRNYADVWHVKK